MEVVMSIRPTKRAFYKYMEAKFGNEFKSQEVKNKFYDKLLDTIQEANKDDANLAALIELTMMNTTDRLIYRNTMACCGVEYTPKQVDLLISTIEYAIEYVS